MQKLKQIKRSYFWLKALVIISVIAVAALLITKQYLILVEIIVSVVAGIILYRVIVHKLEHPNKKQANIEQVYEKQEKTKQEKQQQVDTMIDLSEVKTEDLIKVLSERGEVR